MCIVGEGEGADGFVGSSQAMNGLIGGKEQQLVVAEEQAFVSVFPRLASQCSTGR